MKKAGQQTLSLALLQSSRKHLLKRYFVQKPTFFRFHSYILDLMRDRIFVYSYPFQKKSLQCLMLEELL